jgi:hypothetical protein
LFNQFLTTPSGRDVTIFFLQFIYPASLILLAVLAFQQLELRFGLPNAFEIWAGAMGFACAVGTLLLWTSPIGKISWQNRAAGFLMPWGARLNHGKLWPIPLVSWIVWLAIAGVTGLLFPSSTSEGTLPSIWTRILLLVAWIIDGGGFLYTLGTLSQNFSMTSKSSRSLIFAAIAIAMIMMGSVILYRSGSTVLALGLAGGPPTFLGIFFGSYLGLGLIAGRNARWN